MNKITHVRLENFTAFAKFEQEFSPGINVLIGANSTGKTHLLKVLYAACAITIGEDAEKGFGLKLRNIFNPYDGRIGRLVRRLSIVKESLISITKDNSKTLALNLSKNTDIFHTINEVEWKKEPLESTYVPVKEMLAHAPGFLATASRREIAFEEIYTDIIKRAFLPKLSDFPYPAYKYLLSLLQKAIGGRVITRGEHFFIKVKGRHGDLEFTLLAEGLRKLALLWLLIQNGTLLPDSVLFWDEPEANLNPSLMGQVVEIILELQRLDVQVFLATHNYVLLKEFDLRKKKGDAIRYISLFRDDFGAVTGHASDTYIQIHPNAISDTFADLYQRDIARALKGGAE